MLSSLPEDLLVCILRLLDPDELGVVAHVSRALWHAAQVAAAPAVQLTISLRAVAATPVRVRWAAAAYPRQMEEHRQLVLCWAAFGGQIESVEAVLGLEKPLAADLTPDVTAWASEGGNVAMLQYLVGRGAPVDVRAAAVAALRGHQEALEWLWARHCPRGWVTCAKAAEGGHLGVLQWLRQRHCPWNRMVTFFAVTKGHIDILRWAIDNGCPYEIDELERIASSSGNERLRQAVAYFRDRALNSALVPFRAPA